MGRGPYSMECGTSQAGIATRLRGVTAGTAWGTGSKADRIPHPAAVRWEASGKPGGASIWGGGG